MQGLEVALHEVCPGAPHRFCCRHIWANFNKRWRGLDFKKAFWDCAKATTEQEFEHKMEVVRRLSPDATEWLTRKPPHKWSRSAFATDSKNPALTSNFCEQFNAMILKYRGKPIITMVEGIRAYITSKMVRSQKLLAKYNGHLCPKVQSKLEVMRERSRFWLPQWCGDPEAAKYEVSCPPHSKCVVNLQDRTCSCREWDLSGIPCIHAIACMGNGNYKPEEFVHPLLTKPVNQSIYSHYINPCPGEAFWQRTLLNPVLPPKYKRPPGRPKKQRRKAPEEILDKKNPHKLKRKLGPPKCSRCGVEGHTRRTCKGVGESSSSRPANEEEGN